LQLFDLFHGVFVTDDEQHLYKLFSSEAEPICSPEINQLDFVFGGEGTDVVVELNLG
jgi:hypothetical protein